ncbi:MAG: 3-oxoacyl-[acyl-carrier-protein] reductase [Rhodospirillaceae bacterium]|jgi:3-oxoacyl-[acyl-carrier protein] reductase|nr:3-oxoacyl-[acyl-carrier-protein] reductase [Rhodospirillaceae bacterium]MBT5242114.1 3-oxoacyl-[acyl-carrier-protein] reductase [Rhodospirillaceae bacterium]MBT6090267.1 3-oxoacyl-[acyl-carrier-protein] reductase [Rhodospirillaceae bacterium]MBT6961772.1 3-oxoacyl-[acyl-carrier-protein] reductase [Rhodospirillaceae bacterium]MBT7451928.1 3-oxoacyl-[acyl-carrier-protein] reductase [Rhodospirillaceae bacterium]
MFDLSGKTALVTGATGGIGGAIAKSLHAQGATVVVSGTREAVLNELTADLGDRAHAVPCNLADTAAVETLIGDAEAAGGPLDILVNNAGITRDGLILRMKDEDFWDVMGVNLAVAFRLSRAVVRGMMKRRAGRIISITSIVGVTGNAGQVNYAASKAGLIGFTKSLAQEVASRGITANCVAPGFISTAMTDAMNDQQRDTMMAAIPTGRFGDSADVAAAVTYLASNEAAYVTGQTLHVNGGMAMI